MDTTVEMSRTQLPLWVKFTLEWMTPMWVRHLHQSSQGAPASASCRVWTISLVSPPALTSDQMQHRSCQPAVSSLYYVSQEILGNVAHSTVAPADVGCWDTVIGTSTRQQLPTVLEVRRSSVVNPAVLGQSSAPTDRVRRQQQPVTDPSAATTVHNGDHGRRTARQSTSGKGNQHQSRSR